MPQLRDGHSHSHAPLPPHCGYEHDFDGAIEKRRDILEPWELTPGRAWKAPPKARARRLRLGREPRRAEKVPEREFAVRESSARRSDSGRRSCTCSAWSASASLACCSSAPPCCSTPAFTTTLSAPAPQNTYITSCPSCENLDQLLCIGLGISGLFASPPPESFSKKTLRPRAFYVAAALFAESASSTTSSLWWIGATDQFGGTLSGLIAFAIYVGIVALHFRLNRRLYGG